MVGFSDYARRLQPRDLLQTGWERVYGTNMQHAFMLARRLLGAHPGAEQQVIMITDGEPTAHLEGDVPWFSWPPEPKTLHLTMVEAGRLTRSGATLNVFLLDHDPGAARFVEKMVSTYAGRLFFPDLADLGSMVVRDFLAGEAGLVRGASLCARRPHSAGEAGLVRAKPRSSAVADPTRPGRRAS